MALILSDLGPLAKPAITSLRKLAHPIPGDEWLVGEATAALIKLGDESLGSHTERFLNPKNVNWMRDWEAIQSFHTNAGLSVPRLAKLFNSSQDPEFRKRFCLPLSFNHSNPELTIPILRSLLDHEERLIRNRAAWALGNFGDNAKSALPDLFVLLQRDHTSRGMISNAMLQIDPAVFSKPEFNRPAPR
ncbi:MAG: HEAT repeat domain-containing protein [Verrucomicrobiota bacterium]